MSDRSFDGWQCQQKTKKEMADFRKSDIVPKYKAMIAFLYRNIGTAWHAQYLNDKFEIKGSDIRTIARHARRCGHPLSSGSRGYWIEDNPEKLKACAESLKSRAFDILETAYLMIKAATRRQHWALWSRAVRREAKQMELGL